MMPEKQTYEELNQRVKDLEKQLNDFKQDRERLTYLESAVEQSIDGLAVVDLDGNIIKLNEAFAKMHGYSVDELTGENISIFHTPEQMPAVIEANNKLRQQGKFIGEIWHVRRDGTVFPTLMHNSFFHDKMGNLIGLIGTCRDITERKQADEALRESEKRSQELFDHMGDGVAVYQVVDEGQDFVFVDLNRTAQTLSRIQKEEAVGRRVTEVFPAVERIGLLEVLRRVWRTGQPEHHPLTKYTDGRIEQWVENYVYKLPSGLIVAIYSDTTEKHRVDEALRQSEEQHRAILRTAMDGFWMVDIQGCLLEVNETYCRMSGYSKQELLTMRVSDLEVEEKPEETAAHTNKLMAKGEERFETRHRRKDGSIFDVEISVQYRPTEGKRIVAFLRDITERKRAEVALKESEEKFRTIFESANDEIIYLDQNGNVIDVNERVWDIFGYKPAEVIGKNFAEFPFLDPEALKEIVDRFNRMIFWGETRMASFEANCKDGSKVFVEASTRLVELGNAAKGSLVIIRDITERKRAEEEKANLQAQLHQAQKIESIGTLAGGIAHEFNNILGIILGNTEIAISDVPEWNTVHENLNEIQTACLRARDVVKQLLAFSRTSVAELKPLRLSPVVKEALKLIRSSIPTTIEIRQDISALPDMVKANPTQINQIIINLCTNAAHAMQDTGGVLTVKLENVELADKDIFSHPDLTAGNYIRLTVSDTGCGMNPETTERIFDPFFTTKEVGQGTGMGLSVVHGIIKDHGGSISFYSELGKGATFHVFFPVVESIEAPRDKPFEPMPRGTERILFVDDEEMLVYATKENLEGLGYKVVGSTNPLDILEIFKAQPEKFDLLISDVAMPGMTGDRLAEEVMKIRPNTPVILCTGYSDHISREKAEEKGIKAFVMKPVQTHEMAKAIRQVLDKIAEKEASKAK